LAALIKDMLDCLTEERKEQNKEWPPNQSLQPTGAAFWLFAVSTPQRRPRRLSSVVISPTLDPYA